MDSGKDSDQTRADEVEECQDACRDSHLAAGSNHNFLSD